MSDELISGSILPRLGNPALNQLLDAAIIEHGYDRFAFTIDGYVVQPLQFPGGDIGRLAVSGAVNDLAMCGADPLGIALGMILTEGIERSLVDTVLDSVAATAHEAGVRVISGDTKVIGKSQGDGIYLTTAAIGIVGPIAPRPARVHVGDVLIINGTIGDHGLAVMMAREMPHVVGLVKSDVAPLNKMIRNVLTKVPGISFLRDPTGGGVAGLVVDVAKRTGLHVVLEEKLLPIREEGREAARQLGVDPLDVANAGKVVLAVPQNYAAEVLAILKDDPKGVDATIIGRVEAGEAGTCELELRNGGRRLLQKPSGERAARLN